MSSRREFLTQSTTVALASLVSACATTSRETQRVIARVTRNAGTAPILRVGLIGCGFRGTGAATQALTADPDVRLTAMGDVFADRVEKSLTALRRAPVASQITVTPETSFVGLDAYQRVIESGVDVVILATPPAFRPQHLRAAIAASKHVFCEKPVAVDARGVRDVLASATEAKQRNLSIVSGLCWRYHDGIRECFRRLHDGDIGEIRALHGTYYGNTGSTRFPGTREPNWTDLEWQLRNWYYFGWLSGDHLVEQAVHTVDKVAWAMRDEPPVQCLATGGRAVPAYGNIYDHFHVSYEFANGVRAAVDCRQQDGCYSETTDYITGTKGIFSNGRGTTPTFTGRRPWTYNIESRNMYQTEHDELFASIRAGKPINDGVQMAHSTLMAIMGRMAAYTGQVVTWEQALNSRESLVPEHLDWNMTLAVPPNAIPGQTTLL